MRPPMRSALSTLRFLTIQPTAFKNYFIRKMESYLLRCWICSHFHELNSTVVRTVDDECGGRWEKKCRSGTEAVGSGDEK